MLKSSLSQLSGAGAYPDAPFSQKLVASRQEFKPQLKFFVQIVDSLIYVFQPFLNFIAIFLHHSVLATNRPGVTLVSIELGINRGEFGCNLIAFVPECVRLTVKRWTTATQPIDFCLVYTSRSLVELEKNLYG